MRAAITTYELSKSYRIGELHSAYGTLRDSLAAAARRFAHRERGSHYEEIWALRDVSFDVPEGQVLGIIGKNGAGKSTLLKILTRITTPTSGRVDIRGRVGSLLEVGTGFHPELTGRENVFLNGSVLGMRRQEIQRRFDEIVEFSGIEQFLDTPVKRYSSGMSVRLAFAVAAHLEPEILLIDEVLAVGDAEFQRKCLGRMEDLSGSGRTIVFVSHQMQAVAQLCDRAILLDKGSVALDGPSGDVVARYLQEVGGSRSSRSWREGELPGDDLVRLRSVRVVDERGKTVDAVDVRQPLGLEIAFTVLRANGPAVFPKVKLWDARRNVIFNALDTDPRWADSAEPREYTSTVWIPGNLLNEGLITVDVGVVSIGTFKLRPHTGYGEAVSFHVQDPGEGDTARGRFTGQLQGVVRPLLQWTTDER
jgi:homopolymeric O-antigen transport system ATP-binding protein